MSANGHGTKLEEAPAEQPVLADVAPRKETQLHEESIVRTNGASPRRRDNVMQLPFATYCCYLLLHTLFA